MASEHSRDDAVAAVALLDDRTRRRLYDLIGASDTAVGRDDAAERLGISRELAAFHLDRLVTGGLLTTEYRRRSGKTGPGAGRPAKLYRRAEGDIAISLPERRYVDAAEVFAQALGGIGGPSSVDAVSGVAHAQGAQVGARARDRAGTGAGHARLKATLVELLADSGYEPEVEDDTGTVLLRNCPYHALAMRHRELTCGMNVAWAQGVVAGLEDPRLDAELAPSPGHCCVVFEDAAAPNE